MALPLNVTGVDIMEAFVCSVEVRTAEPDTSDQGEKKPPQTLRSRSLQHQS